LNLPAGWGGACWPVEEAFEGAGLDLCGFTALGVELLLNGEVEVRGTPPKGGVLRSFFIESA